MWLLNLFLLFFLISGFTVGNHPWFTLDKVNKHVVLNSILITLLVFTALMILYVVGFFPQHVAAIFMMGVYTLVSGFFIGYTTRLWKLKKRGGKIHYQHRSFWIDHAPNILAILLILFGLYRTSLITEQAVTGIRLTSGISLMSFGIFSWLFKVVPEYRSKGILLLDQLIEWDKILSWNWVSDDVISIEYIVNKETQNQRIREFVTSIPLDEKKEIESLLKTKMNEYLEQRKSLLSEDR
jgi:uncharacterized membrane protein